MVDSNLGTEWLTETVVRLHREIRRATRAQLLHGRQSELSSVAKQGAGDVSFGIDLPAEALIERAFESSPEPVVVICEGPGRLVFPRGASADRAAYRVIIDPLDGSREIMYDKRSAWVLTGIAPNRGEATNLADVTLGFVTEVPPTRQCVGVEARTIRGGGAFEQAWDLATEAPIGPEKRMQTSDASSIRYGFAPIVRCFPGFHGPLGRLADGLFDRILGAGERSEALVFDDSYISTGGQLYLLASGGYRMVADMRPELETVRAAEGRVLGLCAHPYDLAGIALLVEEAGAILLDPDGERLAYPLDTTTECAYVAFANEKIQDQVWEPLQEELRLLRASAVPS